MVAKFFFIQTGSYLYFYLRRILVDLFSFQIQNFLLVLNLVNLNIADGNIPTNVQKDTKKTPFSSLLGVYDNRDVHSVAYGTHVSNSDLLCIKVPISFIVQYIPGTLNNDEKKNVE